MSKFDRPCLYLWRSNSWCYAQVIDKPTCCVVAAAHVRINQRALLAAQLAARCLAIGVFELRYVTKYTGGTINTLACLRALGINV